MGRPNHRDLILSRTGRKCKSAFLELPPELQDEVIDGLDRGELTLVEASDLIASHGSSLSYEAISNYYKLVRRERRLHDIRNALTDLVAEFQGTDTEQNMRALLNLALAKTIQGLADDEIGIKDLDLARMMAVLKVGSGDGERGAGEEEKAAGGLSEDTVEKIKRGILLG